MLLLESGHVRWKRGERARNAKHTGKEVLGKGNSLHKGPPEMGKMEYSRTGKRSRVVTGGKKSRGQGGKASCGCSVAAGCCPAHPQAHWHGSAHRPTSGFLRQPVSIPDQTWVLIRQDEILFLTLKTRGERERGTGNA